MKETLIKIILATAIIIPTAFSDTWVDGYHRSDGTYVGGYYRSSPNKNKKDNYSTWGNTNPYTGKKGTQNKKECQYSYSC